VYLLNTSGNLFNLARFESVKVGQDPNSMKWVMKGWCGVTLDIEEYPDEQSARCEMVLVAEALARVKVPGVLVLKGGK
jgi:hypothetical protein